MVSCVDILPWYALRGLLSRTHASVFPVSGVRASNAQNKLKDYKMHAGYLMYSAQSYFTTDYPLAARSLRQYY